MTCIELLKYCKEDGVDITLAVAAAIVAIRGIRNTSMALTQEMDERGLAHPSPAAQFPLLDKCAKNRVYLTSSGIDHACILSGNLSRLAVAVLGR